MKSFRLVGCCAIVVLLSSIWVFVARAEEAQQTAEGVDAVAESAPTMCRCGGDIGPNVERIKGVLAEPLKSSGLEFSDEPLDNVVNFLQDEYGIPIQIDEPAMEDAGLTRDEPVTVNVRNVTLRSALRLLLKTKQMTYVIRDEVMIITTPEEAESELIACVYDVRDLVGGSRDIREIKALADAIVSCVARDSWTVHKGGEAEIRTLRPGLLVISQTQAVHEQIAELLSAIRKTLRQPIQLPVDEGMGMMGGRGGHGFGRGGTGQEYGEGYGGRGSEAEPESTPADETPVD
jgi:hypothetical protein